MNDEPNTGSNDSTTIDRRTALKGGVATLGLLALGGAATGSAVAASGANKVYLADASLEEIAKAQNAMQSDAVILSSGSFKTSTNSDLIIQATAEVGLYTEIKTKGNDESVASAGVECWVELDGEPVPYPAFGGDGSLGNDFTGGDGTVSRANGGSVVFANRDFGMKTSDFENLEAQIELFLRTRSANGFNWYIANVGQGEHTIELKALISQNVDGKGEAKALVGPRTLIVEPVNMSS